MDMLEWLASVLYYLFVTAGSVTLGYLVLRLGYADVRTFSKEERLGLAAVVGFAAALLSFLSDAVLASPEKFVAAEGYTTILLFAWAGVFFLAFKLYFHRTKGFLVVGVPLGKPLLKTSKPEELQEKTAEGFGESPAEILTGSLEPRRLS